MFVPNKDELKEFSLGYLYNIKILSWFLRVLNKGGYNGLGL
jgi:hypothetical protein